MSKEWDVVFTSKSAKQARKLAKREKDLLTALIRDLQVSGPIAANWPNYSKLSKHRYHCHLNRKWVACWMMEEGALQLIEIYYVGSREDAPY